MPRPALRSRTIRKVKVKVPGNKVKTHYRGANPRSAKCSSCKKALHGLKRLGRTKAKNATKTDKTVSRPFGGNLCTGCMRKVFVERARR